MLAARGLREEEDGSHHRIAQEFLVAVRRQAARVVRLSVLGAMLLTLICLATAVLLARSAGAVAP